MVYFTDKDVEVVKKQRKTAIIILSIIIFLFVLTTVGFILWYRTLPYQSPVIKKVKWIHYPITGLFVVFLFLYIGIYFRRINKRYNYQQGMLTGIRETSVGTFIEYSEELQDKEGVDFKALIFLEWNKYKKDFFERKVLVFFDRDFPIIEKDSKVEYTTQSNVLIEYKILGKVDESENDK
ncbi:MAG: hypothetical protein KBS91_03190 [Firmicutes bacterium]|nr:hypothetical protein [Candidatus Caballimonas caccae]